MATHGLRAALPGMSRMTNTGNAVAWQPFRRFVPLAAIVLGHVVLFHVVQTSLRREETASMSPREVVVRFITPPAPVPQAVSKPEPRRVEPKTVPVVKKQVRQARPEPTPVNTTPSQHAISTPPPDPSPPVPAPAAPPVAAAPAPAAPPAPSVPQTVTSGIEYVQPPQPEYPPVSKRMGEEGKAVVRVLVNEKGRPEQAEVQRTSGSARLDEAARLAVLRAVFKPFMENGRAVAAYAIVPIRFQLN